MVIDTTDSAAWIDGSVSLGTPKLGGKVAASLWLALLHPLIDTRDSDFAQRHAARSRNLLQRGPRKS